MKIFPIHNYIYSKISRFYLAEWIKPLFPKHRHSLFGLDPSDLEISQNESDSDAFILPLTWNYYFDELRINKAIDSIGKYLHWDKPIFSWAGGDYTLKIPNQNAFLFRQNGYQSLRRENEHAYPVIIKDPLNYLNWKEIKIVKKEKNPKIGFCGLASNNWIDTNLRAIKDYIFRSKIEVKKPYLDLSVPISGTNLRRKTLKILSNSKLVDTNFLVRSSSGGQKINSREQKLEFWENIISCPYILCIRGAGNYSARFYETLAMGRIPIFVNTDCILPLDNQINWKNHCVWVEDYELDNILKIINNFHAKLSDDEFAQIQIDNRELWIKKLTFHGFYNSFKSKYEN